MLSEHLSARWGAFATRTGYAEDSLTTIAVAVALDAAERGGERVWIDRWREFNTVVDGALVRFWPRWVRQPPTPGTWTALARLAAPPHLEAVRGTGEGVRVGSGTDLAASNTTWALIDRGCIEVSGDTAALTPIGHRMLTAYQDNQAATAARRAAYRARASRRPTVTVHQR